MLIAYLLHGNTLHSTNVKPMSLRFKYEKTPQNSYEFSA